MAVAKSRALVASRGGSYVSSDNVLINLNGNGSSLTPLYVPAQASMLKDALGIEGCDAVRRCIAVYRISTHAVARLYGVSTLGRRLRRAGERLALEPRLAVALEGRSLRRVLAACEAPTSAERLARALGP